MVAVHLDSEIEQRLAGVTGRPARDDLVVLDHRPRDVGDDVQRERDDEQADDQPDRRQAPAGAEAQPAHRRVCRRVEHRRRIVGLRGRGERPEAEPADEHEQRVQGRGGKHAHEPELERGHGDRADGDRRGGVAA